MIDPSDIDDDLPSGEGAGFSSVEADAVADAVGLCSRVMPGAVLFGVLVEVGTWTGRSTIMLARRLPDWTIYTIDSYPEDYPDAFRRMVGPATARELAEHSLAPHKNVRRILDDSVHAAHEWVDDFVDAVFLDGGHSEDQAREDVFSWTARVRPGGIMALHDWCAETHPGVISGATPIFEAYGWERLAGYPVETVMAWRRP